MINKKKIAKTLSNVNTDCCTHYNGGCRYQICYAILPCFKLAICQDCEDVQLVCNKFFTFLFSLIYPLWNGRAVVEYDITYRS